MQRSWHIIAAQLIVSNLTFQIATKKKFMHHLKQSKQQENPNKRFNFILNVIKSMDEFKEKAIHKQVYKAN